MGSELAFWAFHKDPPKEVESKDQELIKNKRQSRSDSLFAGATEPSSHANYQPSKVERRRFSLDFILSRRSSKGKIKIANDKRGSDSSTDSADSQPPPPQSNQNRRGSTRMEGKGTDIAAWCFV